MTTYNCDRCGSPLVIAAAHRVSDSDLFFLTHSARDDSEPRFLCSPACLLDYAQAIQPRTFTAVGDFYSETPLHMQGAS